MNIFSYIKQYTDQCNGQFTEYDNSKAVVVVPTFEGRFQTILVTIKNGKSSGNQLAALTSKVCEYNTNIDVKTLLEQNATFDYSKFILEDGHLKVEACCEASTVSQGEVKHMVQEVANLADTYEMKLTGKDIH